MPCHLERRAQPGPTHDGLRREIYAAPERIDRFVRAAEMVEGETLVMQNARFDTA